MKNNNILFKQFWKDIYDKYILNNPGITFSSNLEMETELIPAEDNE